MPLARWYSRQGRPHTALCLCGVIESACRWHAGVVCWGAPHCAVLVWGYRGRVPLARWYGRLGETPHCAVLVWGYRGRVPPARWYSRQGRPHTALCLCGVIEGACLRHAGVVGWGRPHAALCLCGVIGSVCRWHAGMVGQGSPTLRALLARGADMSDMWGCGSGSCFLMLLESPKVTRWKQVCHLPEGVEHGGGKIIFLARGTLLIFFRIFAFCYSIVRRHENAPNNMVCSRLVEN